jgi:hypothetical protein
MDSIFLLLGLVAFVALVVAWMILPDAGLADGMGAPVTPSTDGASRSV